MHKIKENRASDKTKFPTTTKIYLHSLYDADDIKCRALPKIPKSGKQVTSSLLLQVLSSYRSDTQIHKKEITSKYFSFGTVLRESFQLYYPLMRNSPIVRRIKTPKPFLNKESNTIIHADISITFIIVQSLSHYVFFFVCVNLVKIFQEIVKLS